MRITQVRFLLSRFHPGIMPGFFIQTGNRLFLLRGKMEYKFPLERKKQLLRAFSGKEITVCEDVDGHYKYWRDNFNPNPADCCNLRKAGENG